MLELIKNVPNQKIIDLEYLKISNFPLFLYGSGSYAADVKYFLDRHKIPLTGIAVDDTYYHSNLSFENYNVLPFGKIFEKHSLVNIIVVFSKYREKIAELSFHPNVSKCMFIDAPDRDVFFDYDFIKSNSAKLEDLYHNLADDYSRKIMLAFINAKISGCPGDLYDLNVPDEKQYFPHFLHIPENVVFVDCGAFTGDTILDFNRQTNGKYNKIYAFECDKINIEKLKKNTDKLNNVTIIEKGCFSEKCTLSFSNIGSGISSINDNGASKVEVEAIDNVVKRDENPVFIKMDIEGAELAALKGSAKTIVNGGGAMLAISVYHKPEDLITIPQYILSLNKNYQFYLRHYGYNSWETILYAVGS